MKTEILPYSQTRSFVTVWMIELWERFGYYSQSVAALDAGNTYAGRGRTLAVTFSRMF